MLRTTTTIIGLMAALSLGGCKDEENCYWVEDDAPDVGADRAPDPGLRNPETGLCEFFGGGGGGGYYYCEDDGGGGGLVPPTTGSGSSSGGAEAPDQAFPAWGECYGACDGLGEDQCMDTEGCQAAYSDSCGEASCRELATYQGCWQVSAGGGSEDACEDIKDAYQCSTRDDCKKFHDNAGGATPADDEAFQVPPAYGNFSRCESEGSSPGPGSCEGDVFCDANPPTCEAGSTPGIAEGCWTGACIPDAMCGGGDHDPGNCYEEAVCLAPTPACPEGTLPGVKNGCWTGYCIPENACEAAPSCSSLASEDQCIAADCSPFYQGENCECDGEDCTCQDWVFSSCME